MATAPALSKAPPTPQKATGTHFYKYGNLKEPIRLQRLKAIILEHRLYVPMVKEFKDPTDCRPRLAPLSEDQMFSTFYNGPVGILGRNPSLDIGAQVLTGLMLDSNIRKHGAETLMRRVLDVRDQELKNFKVYCLSKRNDNLSMWDHYADYYRGYCLEFASEGLFFDSAKEVIYGDTIEMDISNPEHHSSWSLYCKRQEYSFEEEVRVVVPRIFSQVVPFEPTQLTRIILGHSISEAHQNEILEIAKQRDPQLDVVVASWDPYKQDFKFIPKDLGKRHHDG
jgi:hypothetical protein